MLRMAAIVLMLGAFTPAIAEDQPPKLPENTIKCSQFKKTGPKEWSEVDTAVFNLGDIRDIHLTNQPVTPGFFKFGGIDVYPVLEQKCGQPRPQAPSIGNTSNAKGEAPVILAQNTASPKAEAEQTKGPPPAHTQAPAQTPKTAAEAKDKTPKSPPVTAGEAPVILAQDTASLKAEAEQTKASPPASTQAPARTSKTAAEAEDKTPKSQPVTAQCGDGKVAYAAGSLTDGAGEKPVIEIVFKNKMSEGNSDFELKNQRGNEVLWAYKGKIRRGRFRFTPVVTEIEDDDDLYMYMYMPVYREETIALTPIFIKPNRFGAGEPILYLNGLRKMFASKESVRRFKFEGKPAPEPLPEAYYFDRCE